MIDPDLIAQGPSFVWARDGDDGQLGFFVAFQSLVDNLDCIFGLLLDQRRFRIETIRRDLPFDSAAAVLGQRFRPRESLAAVRGDAPHGLRKKCDERFASGAPPLADDRLIDGLGVQFVLSEVRSTPPAPLDEPEPAFVVRGHRVQLLQHLLGGEMLCLQNRGDAAFRGSAQVVHGL